VWAVLEVQGNPAFPVKLAIPALAAVGVEVAVFLLITPVRNLNLPQVRPV
jgi:hypothetical protein